MSGLLLIAAFDPELAPLRDWAAGRPDVALGTVGVGMVQASAGTMKLLTERNPRRVLFIGSVGCARGKNSIFSFVTATKAVLADRGLASGDAFLPAVSAREYASSPGEIEKLAACAEAAPVYSAAAITATEALACELTAQTGAQYESMELFGVAAACAIFGTPWSSLSCVTNFLGPTGHKEWLTNHIRAAELTAAAVRDLTA